MKVKEIMHGITMINSDISVLEAAKIMSNKEIGSVLIKISEIPEASKKSMECSAEDPCIIQKPENVGILTERDILKNVVAKNMNLDTKVSEVMTRNIFSIDAEADMEEASELFNKHHIRRLVVTERGNITGILTARDVAKSIPYVYLQRRKEYMGNI